MAGLTAFNDNCDDLSTDAGFQFTFKCDLCDGDPKCISFCQNKYILAVDLKVDKKDKELAQAQVAV